MTCPLCYPAVNVVHKTQHWTVVLNDDQGYLGRCYFALNRHETDLTKLTEAEILSLWPLVAAVKSALDKQWRPDHYNYVFLMNVQPHLHGHIIPRYAEKRIVDGVVFHDGELGKHYSLINILVPEQNVLAKITDLIKSTLPEGAETHR